MEAENPTPEGERPWILATTDFSPHSRNALLRATSLAGERNAELLVLHVIETGELAEIARLAEYPEKDLRERIAAERRAKLEAMISEVTCEIRSARDLSIDPVISWGPPFAQILQKAAEFQVDLIVLGIAGRSADLERALFGSTAEKVLRGTRCDVLCVPLEQAPHRD